MYSKLNLLQEAEIINICRDDQMTDKQKTETIKKVKSGKKYY